MPRTLTAMYDTRGAADSARDELVGLGVPSANIVIRGTESGAAGSTATEEKGFWGRPLRTSSCPTRTARPMTRASAAVVIC